MITYGKHKKKTEAQKLKEFEILFNRNQYKRTEEDETIQRAPNEQLENHLLKLSLNKSKFDGNGRVEHDFATNRDFEPLRAFDISKSKTESVKYDNCVQNMWKMENISLDTLLSICDQQKPSKFTTYIKPLKVQRKIGEASYSDVYLSHQITAIKIIPILGQEQSTLKQAYQELKSTKQLQGIKGYVNLIDAKVLKGKYEHTLIELFDLYKLEKESENVHPNEYMADQLYLCLVMDYCGIDLEHFLISKEYKNCMDDDSWDLGQPNQSSDNFWLTETSNLRGSNPENVLESIFIQVLKIITAAEDKFDFEHRDLHWGNIMIKKTTENHINGILTFGIQVTLIDFSLSRYVFNEVYYYDLEDDGFFDGEGDLQFDIYRWMRDEIISIGDSKNTKVEANSEDTVFGGNNRADWGFKCLKTNTLVKQTNKWMYYLLYKLLGFGRSKRLTLLKEKCLEFQSARALLEHIERDKIYCCWFRPTYDL